MAVKRIKSTRTTRPAAKTPRVPRRAPAKKAASSATGSKLREVVLAALDDMKAIDISALDVRGLTDITDTMIVATGTSDRHVKSIADRVIERCREAGHRTHGIEGEREGEWVLVDLQDLIGQLLESHGNRVAVHLAVLNGLQHQHVERAVQLVTIRGFGFRHGQLF